MRLFICKDTGEEVASYHEYLKTEHWKGVKERFYNSKFPNSCYVCGSTHQLNLHHKSYKRVGNERLNDLIYLCQDHHEEVHNRLKNCNRKLWTVARSIRKRWEKSFK